MSGDSNSCLACGVCYDSACPISASSTHRLILPQAVAAAVTIPLSNRCCTIATVSHCNGRDTTYRVAPPAPIALHHCCPLTACPARLPYSSHCIAVPVESVLTGRRITVCALSKQLVHAIRPTPIVSVHVLPSKCCRLQAVNGGNLSRHLKFFGGSTGKLSGR